MVEKELSRNELAKIAFDRLLTNIEIVYRWNNQKKREYDKDFNLSLDQFIAKLSVRFADELIAELER